MVAFLTQLRDALCFFRKVCANCHCPREEHDIRPHEERQAAVGKLLFHSDAETMVKDASKSPKRYLSISNLYLY